MSKSKMRCLHCSAENPLIAHYCGNCGHSFTEEERKKAYSRTIYGKVDRAREIIGRAPSQVKQFI